jgi:small subunit ribosomal protein S5e
MYIFLLQDYIAVKEKNAKYLPHSAGRYAAKRFRKAQCPIVERLTNSLMMHGRNNGKKLMAVRIVKHAFEIIHLLTGEVSMLTSLVLGVYLTLRMEAARSSET